MVWLTTGEAIPPWLYYIANSADAHERHIPSPAADDLTLSRIEAKLLLGGLLRGHLHLNRKTRMETLEAIHTRRSIRKYTDQPIDPQVLEQILAAGMMAPSARNEQAWQFVVVQNRDTLAALSKISPYAAMAEHAAAAIVVCGDTQRETVADLNYWVIDCAAAAQNLLLAAHALGLGAVWTAVYPRAERIAALRQVLPLPDHIIPLCLVPLGYPAESKGPVNRFDLERIHREQW
jgi:nitroreductase